MTFKNNKLRKGVKILGTFYNLFLENRFHGINYNDTVNDYIDEM